jgi:hypothetical protein
MDCTVNTRSTLPRQTVAGMQTVRVLAIAFIKTTTTKD